MKTYRTLLTFSKKKKKREAYTTSQTLDFRLYIHVNSKHFIRIGNSQKLNSTNGDLK